MIIQKKKNIIMINDKLETIFEFSAGERRKGKQPEWMFFSRARNADSSYGRS